jgi:Flp pilus assembly protein TadG
VCRGSDVKSTPSQVLKIFPPVSGANTAHRKNERGVTIVLVAFSLLALLGMAALAIDVSTLYVAHGEAQRAADAAALAGAKMFAFSGYTSASTTLPAADICQTSATPGADAAANRQAEATAAQNLVAGQPAAVQSIICNTTAANPEITVTVQRTGLPTFFGRIWGGTANSVTATAVAEAYNPSGSMAPIQVQGVKPWLIPNCDPTNPAPANPDCTLGAYFINPLDGSIENNGSFVGRVITLVDLPGNAAPTTTPLPPTTQYYHLNVPTNPPAPACPSTSSVSCSQVGSDPYHDNIACFSTSQFSCGQTIGSGQNVTIQPNGAVNAALTDEGTQCLIHASGPGPGPGQDQLTPTGTLPNTTPPIRIEGGDNNPNPALQGQTNISRSDSIVSVPIYQSLPAGNPNLCPGGACTGTGTVVAFLQLGIQAVGPPGQIKGVIMNVSGCNPAAGGTAVSGGGVSPIPVRLIHQ